MMIPNAQQSVNKIVANMHSIAQSHTPTAISIGQVKSPPPDLVISWNGIELEKEQLYCDFFLLKNYKRSAKGSGEYKTEFEISEATGNIETLTDVEEGGEEEPEFISHEHEIDDEYSIEDTTGKGKGTGKHIASQIFTDYGLKAGDYVAVLPIEGAQKFIILAKLIYMKDYKEDDKPDDSYEGSLEDDDKQS